MEHIIYWSGDTYALTSSIFPVNEDALFDKQILADLDGKGIVLTVQLGGVVPATAAEYQIISPSLDELLGLVPDAEKVYVVLHTGEVCLFPAGETECIKITE